MATQKLKDYDLVSDIAEQLGITARQLDSMSLDEIRALIESDDLDPASKARLVRARLGKLRDELDVADEVLRQAADEEVDSGRGKRTQKRAPAAA